MKLDLKRSGSKWRKYFTPNNLGLYVFALLAFSISWSTAKVIQKNYQIQKDIAALRQENEVRELENDKLKHQIEYYKSDSYLELEARRKFNKAAAGEKVIVFPRPADQGSDTVDPDPTELSESSKLKEAGRKTNWQDNLKAWRDFLLLR